MQPVKTRKIPGLVAKAKISSGNTMNVPKAVMRYWSLEVGDVLEFYNPMTDIPDEYFRRFEVMAVVIRRKNPVDPEAFRKAYEEAVKRGMPPILPGKHKVPVTK